MSSIDNPAQRMTASEILALPSVKESLDRARRASRQGDLERSMGVYDNLLQQHGPVAEVLSLKALIFARSGRFDSARDVIEAALKLNSSRGSIHANAAHIHSKLSHPKQARRHAQEAIRLEPRRTNVLFTAAVVFRESGDHARSSRVVEKIIQIEPSHAQAWHLKAKLASDLGRADEAEEALAKALSLQPENSFALAALANLLQPGLDDSEMVSLLEAHHRGHLRSFDRIPAVVALADIYQRGKQYEQAYSLYEEANTAQLASRPFPIEDFEEGVEAVIGVMSDPPPLDSDRAKNDRPALKSGPVFVIGMPRSGTTLLEQVLSSHSAVFGCGLNNGMEAAERSLERQGVITFLPTGAKSATEGQLAAVRSEYLIGLSEHHRDYPIFVDNNPLNFQRVAMIKRIFPSARFIHCVRHPLDNVLSCFFHHFQEGMNFSVSLQNTARYYAAQQRLIAHWKMLYPDSILQVSYEDLVTDLPATVGALCSFIGLEEESAMLQPHMNPRPVMSASVWQVRQPIDDSRMGYWKHYQKQLEPVIGYFQAGGVLDESLVPN
jgi:Flp pilus assembly protein TadD